MSGELVNAPADALGPVDLLVVAFPDGVTGGEGFEVLLELVHARVIYVLDLEVVEHCLDGVVRVVDLSSVSNPDGLDLSAFDGSSSGLLDADDIDAVGRSIEPGGLAAVVVYENVFAERLTSAFDRSGGRVISRNSVSVDDLSAALDRVESVDPE